MDETKGYYTTVTRPKPTAVPPDGVNKVAYFDDDWETVQEFVPYAPQELEAIENNKRSNELPNRVDTIETTQEEMVLFLADMIGGATNED